MTRTMPWKFTIMSYDSPHKYSNHNDEIGQEPAWLLFAITHQHEHTCQNLDRAPKNCGSPKGWAWLEHEETYNCRVNGHDDAVNWGQECNLRELSLFFVKDKSRIDQIVRSEIVLINSQFSGSYNRICAWYPIRLHPHHREHPPGQAISPFVVK